MRSGITAVLASALAAALAGGFQPATGAEPAVLPREEIQLAERSFEQGLYAFAAMRLGRLLERDGLEDADRARLLLAKSLYLSGREEEAVRRLEAFPGEHPESRHLLECRVWTGRAATEHLGKHKEAEEILRPALQDITGAAGRGMDDRTRVRLTSQCRYFLCLAIVEQADSAGRHAVSLLDDLWDAGGKRRIRSGALSLLADQIAAPEGSEFVAEAHVLRGRALYLRGRPDQCFQKLQDGFLDQPIGKRDPALRAEALFWQAEARYAQSRWEEARALYERSADASAKAGASALHCRARLGTGWALHKRAAELRRSSLDVPSEMLESALASFAEASAEAAKAGKAADADETGYQALSDAASLMAGAELVALGNCQEALKRLEPLYAKPLLEVEARMLAAQAETALGRHDRAGKLLTEAAAKLPDPASPAFMRTQFALGRNAFARGRWDEAHRAFSRVAERSPSDCDETHEARLWLALVLAKQKSFEQAAATIAPLLENLQASEALHVDRLNYHLGEILLQRAESEGAGATRAGQRDIRTEALRAFTASYRASPMGPFAIRARFGAAATCLGMKPAGTQDAFQQYSEVLASRQASTGEREEARLGMARALRMSGSFRKAAEFLQSELLEARPPASAHARGQALRMRAECLAEGGEPQKAAEAFALLASEIGSGPEAIRARIKLSGQLRKLGMHAQAARELTALAPSAPADLAPEVLYAAAQAELAAGRPTEALDLFVKYADDRSAPHRAEARVTAAGLAYAAGRTESAREQADKALKDLPPAEYGGPSERLLASRALILRAKTQMAANNAAAAIEDYRQADLQASVAAFDEPSKAEARELEMTALLGLGHALSKSGALENAAASFLRAANLPSEDVSEDVRADFGERTRQALSLAAEALAGAGSTQAASQVRALLASRSAAARPTAAEPPAPPPPAPDAGSGP